MHKIKYTRYPNNEVRVTHYYRAEPKYVNPPSDTDAGSFSCPGTASVPDGEGESVPSPSLDISADFLHPPEKKMRTKTKFGLNAKRTILRIGGALDTVDPTPHHYVFLTGTIPGGTHDAFMAVAEESGYIVDALSKWLKRTCPCEHWFYVWELQARGALHIHWCVHSPDTSIRNKLLRSWWGKWHSIIQEVASRSATDMWLRKDGTYHKKGHSVLQAHAQEVHKSVAAYMAGYCGGSKDKHSTDASSPYYPNRWWGASRATTTLLKSLTDEMVVEYPDYRGANREMQLVYEAVSHDTPLAHKYPHKVGVGSTCVSYHPEDKGTSIWNQLTMTVYNPLTHPNVCSLILSLERYIEIWHQSYRISKKHKGTLSERLLQDCEDLLLEGSLQRCTLSQKAVRIVDRTLSEYSLNTLHRLSPELALSECVPPIWMLSQTRHLLKWDRHGWLSLENDLPVRLTECWSLCDSSTTDPDGTDAVSEGGPQQCAAPPLSKGQQLCLFSDSLESH